MLYTSIGIYILTHTHIPIHAIPILMVHKPVEQVGAVSTSLSLVPLRCRYYCSLD